MNHPEITLHVQMEPLDHTAWSAFVRREIKPGVLRYSGILLLVVAAIFVVILYNLLVLATLPPQAAGGISVGLTGILFSFVWRWIRVRFKPQIFDPKGAYLR